MAVRFSTIHRRAFYAMRTYYYLLTTNGFYRDSIASASYPSYPRMSSTLSTAHPWLFRDMPQLRTFDNKLVRRVDVEGGEIEEYRELKKNHETL